MYQRYQNREWVAWPTSGLTFSIAPNLGSAPGHARLCGAADGRLLCYRAVHSKDRLRDAVRAAPAASTCRRGERREMATIEAVTPRAYVGTPQRGPITRLLEDERWLASACCCRRSCCSALFIAYPFVKGVELAVTDTKVGVPGHFVGLRQFRQDLERQHLPRRGVEHLPLHASSRRSSNSRSVCGWRCC